MEEVEKLARFLHHGTVKQVASKTGCSRQYASKVQKPIKVTTPCRSNLTRVADFD